MIKLLFAIIGLTDVLQNQKIARPIRELVDIQEDHRGRIVSYGDSFLTQMFMCFRCLSVWVTIFFVLLKLISGKLFSVTVDIFSLSYLAYLIFDTIPRIQRKLN